MYRKKFTILPYEFKIESTVPNIYRMSARKLGDIDLREIELFETTPEEIEQCYKSGTDQQIFRTKFNPGFIKYVKEYFEEHPNEERIITLAWFIRMGNIASQINIDLENHRISTEKRLYSYTGSIIPYLGINAKMAAGEIAGDIWTGYM
jgi:hypothetical protein